MLFICTSNQLKKHKMSDVKSKVISIIVDKLGVDEGEVTTEASFTNDLGADSLNIVEVVMGIEQEFDIEIPDEDAETLFTVGQVKQYIEDNS